MPAPDVMQEPSEGSFDDLLMQPAVHLHLPGSTELVARFVPREASNDAVWMGRRRRLRILCISSSHGSQFSHTYPARSVMLDVAMQLGS